MLKKAPLLICSAPFFPFAIISFLSYLIFSLVSLFPRPSFSLAPSFSFLSIFSQSPSPFFHLFSNCLSLSVSPRRMKEGETGADNDLMYGPVMSLVDGQTPLFPRATRNRLHGSIGLLAKESRKREIFARKILLLDIPSYILCPIHVALT